MHTVTASVKKLVELVQARKAADLATIEAARSAYAEAVAANEAQNGNLVAAITKEIANALGNGGRSEDRNTSVSRDGARSFSAYVNLPDSTEWSVVELPINPDGRGGLDALSVHSEEWHDRKLTFLSIVGTDTIEVNADEFGYYL